MPIHHRQRINAHLQLLVWKIDEPLAWFEQHVQWHQSDKKKYEGLKHVEKKREFLALRCCLKEHFGQNPEVLYQPNGKPYLHNKYRTLLSFTHTKGFAAAAFSRHLPVGIDLEHHRPAIRKLENRILRPEEQKVLCDESRIEHLLFYWGAKECIIKITGDKSLDAKENLRIAPFTYRENTFSHGLLVHKGTHIRYSIYFRKLDQLYLTFGWEEISDNYNFIP